MIDSVSKGDFERRGFLPPQNLFSPAECENIIRQIRNSAHIRPHTWIKGHAVTNRVFHQLARHPTILKVVTALLGKDVLLWGASLAVRKPKENHRWHTDMETAAPESRAVSVWIGLENVDPACPLLAIDGSHRLGFSIQEAAARRNRNRTGLVPTEVESWAQESLPEAALSSFGLTNGQALYFDGRLWHASINVEPRLRRTALLLQYCSARTPIRIPNFGNTEFPFSFREEKPPCLLVSGQADLTFNRIVRFPRISQFQLARRVVYRLKRELIQLTAR